MRDNHAYVYEPVTKHAPKRCVLLIEDNKSDVQLVRQSLENPRNPILLLDTPRMIDALLLLDHAKFDVIVLDLNFADSHGSASVAAVRAAAPFTPIIVYSGIQNERLQEEALICGATYCLQKGQEGLRELTTAIEHLLRRIPLTAQELL